jgi:hypothetical protein
MRHSLPAKFGLPISRSNYPLSAREAHGENNMHDMRFQNWVNEEYGPFPDTDALDEFALAEERCDEIQIAFEAWCRNKELFDETFRQCMPQATEPFYTKITRLYETGRGVVGYVIMFDGATAAFEVDKPDFVGCYGFACLMNHGAAFEWRDRSWRRCVARVSA